MRADHKRQSDGSRSQTRQSGKTKSRVKRQLDKRVYLVTLAAAVAALLPFASKLIWRSISIDTEQMINTPRQMLTSWLYHERPGLVISKYLFGQTEFRYNVEIIGTLAFLAAACMVWLYFIRQSLAPGTFGQEDSGTEALDGEHLGRSSWRQGPGIFFSLVFPLLFLTHPALMEQLHFLLQSMEVAWSILLCFVAAGLLSEWCWHRRPLWRLLVGIVAMVWSFASYQSLTALYIAAAAGLFLLYYNVNAKKADTPVFWWRLAFSHVAVFVLGFVLSRAAAKAGLYIATGSTESTAYVAGMVKWGSRPAVECLRELYHYGKQMIGGQGPYYSLAYLTAALGTIAVLIGRWSYRRKSGQKENRSNILYLLAGVVLYISPFLLPLYLGGAAQVRAQLAMPFVIAFGWSYLLYLLADTACESVEGHGANTALSSKGHTADWLSAKGRLLTAGFLLMAGAFFLVQLQQTIRLERTAYEVYRQECVLSREIAEAVDAAGAPEGVRVQFVGRWSPSLTAGMVQGETTGNSFYEWDAEKAYGSTERILGLWATLGYLYESVELQAAPAGCERAADMPCWPEAGSVSWDGETVLIKLSP